MKQTPVISLKCIKWLVLVMDMDCVTLLGRNPRYYRGADKSLARPTSRCILFDGENISFDASLVLYIYIHTYIYTYIHKQ